MPEAEQGDTIRRILVALDASPHSLAALQAAVELAAQLGAQVEGLFVEDINLLKLSDLPMARELVVYATHPRQLDRKRMAEQLQLQARMARKALEEVAEKAQVHWNFRVARGVIAAELLAAAEEMDLILLGRTGWSNRRRLGSTTLAVASQAGSHTLIIQRGAHLGLPVGIVYDGSIHARRAFITAVDLLRQRDGYLVIIIKAEDLKSARQLQTEITDWVRERNVQSHYRWLVGEDMSGLTTLIDEEGCGILVLPAEVESLQGENLKLVLDQVQCPVLLVH
ncbi:MAG: universal stress protein [Anaerolineales bacterium]|jgi:nucleotide-binding universal stress UspA family protein